MARQIIKRWKLAVLRVGLDLTGREPMVVSRLDGYVSGSDVTYWQRSDPLSAFGQSHSAQIPTHVVLPREFVRAVQTTMSRELRHESVLWLRLEPPYGYLGAAPWEDLAADIDVPVLRVPDRLPTSTALGRTWSVAIAVSAPRGARWGAKHVSDFTTALRGAFYGAVEVDVFPDANTYELLLREGGTDATIRVHDPADARTAHQRRSAELRDTRGGRRTSGLRIFETEADPRLLWADWIVSGLAGRAVRALHVASLGVASADQPALTISPEPSRSVKASSCISVDTNDLWTLADTVGASLVSIGAPESRRIDVGARMVADGLGQLRPGPTLFTSLRRDPGSQALAEAHAFLAEPTGRPLPSHPSWFGYIQPESIQEQLSEPLLPHHTGQQTSATPASRSLTGIDLRMSVDPDGALAANFRDADEVPAWVASSSRFLESQHADLSRSLSTPGQGKESKQAYDIGLTQALVDIEAMVQRHLGES